MVSVLKIKPHASNEEIQDALTRVFNARAEQEQRVEQTIGALNAQRHCPRQTNEVIDSHSFHSILSEETIQDQDAIVHKNDQVQDTEMNSSLLVMRSTVRL